MTTEEEHLTETAAAAGSQDTAAAAAPRLLPLDGFRTITLTVGKTPLVYKFKRIEQKAWLKFMESVVSRVEQRGEQRISVSDEDPALVDLFDGAIVTADGYVGGEPTVAGGTRIVPLKHRVAAASVLRAVSAEVEEVPTLAIQAEVRLSAPWSVDEKGQMEMYTGLVHRFTAPSLDQYRRFRLGCARTAVTGGPGDSVTVYPSRLAVALSLYDDMIAEVEGYSANGVDLAGAPLKEVQTWMDGMHKARAVLELFDRSEEEISIGAPKAAADGTTE